MKGNRPVNPQKLMKKLLALPVFETMEGKRAVELSRVLEAVRASSITERTMEVNTKGCLYCAEAIGTTYKLYCLARDVFVDENQTCSIWKGVKDHE